MDEIIMLLNHIGDHYAEVNDTRLAALYFQKAKEAETRSALVRQAVLTNEQLSRGGLAQQLQHANSEVKE